MAVFRQGTQLICGQELRLRGEAAKGAVMAAKAEGWKVALAEAVSTQVPGEKEDAKHTSVGAGVAVRGDRGIAFLPGETEWELSPPGQGGRIAAAWVDSCGGFILVSIYLRTGEGLSAGNIGLLQKLKEVLTKHGRLWVCAGDFNMEPD